MPDQDSARTTVRGYEKAKQSAQTRAGRWATIKRVAEAWDSTTNEEIVIDIKQMESNAVPQISAELTSGENENAGRYAVERVPDGVRIGMVRGGGHQAVAGFGWRNHAHKLQNGG